MGERFTDQAYLRGEQYRDGANLRARMALHARFSTCRHPWQRWVFERLALPPAARVLELGCGPGRLWLENADRLPPNWHPVLSDYSPGMVREARRNLGDAGIAGGVAFANLDAQAIPFPDAAFDAVVANHMLYHIPDRDRALAEIRRVLRPGGRLFAATNGAGHMRELHDLLRRADPRAAAPPTLGFRLENGRAALVGHFTHVALERHEDGIVATEAGPLVAYLLSLAPPATARERVAAVIEHELAARGAIRITKSTGLFIAR